MTRVLMTMPKLISTMGRHARAKGLSLLWCLGVSVTSVAAAWTVPAFAVANTAHGTSSASAPIAIRRGSGGAAPAANGSVNGGTGASGAAAAPQGSAGANNTVTNAANGTHASGTAPTVSGSNGASATGLSSMPSAAGPAGATTNGVAAATAPGAASGVVPASMALALPDFTSLVDKVGPAVVNIRTTQRVSLRQARSGRSPDDSSADSDGGSGGSANGGGQGDSGPSTGDMADFFRRFFGIPLPPGLLPNSKNGTQPKQQTPEVERDNGLGSGFILSADGYVMTNAHVVEGADSIYVTLTDRRQFKARLIGLDKMTDVAVVKIAATDLPMVTIGDSEKVKVGEWVLAIGSPFGLENTVTAGIVSAKSRYTGEYLPFIQTDVAVNPGNSGGPLIDMNGEVIGINSQIYSRTGGFMGISFSIPIDEAIRVANQLKTTGVVTRGRIGVMIGPVTADVAESLGLPRSEGALVSNVVSGGPAEKAGVEAGDIILNYDGHAIDQFGDLPRLVGGAKPGTEAPMVVWRKGQTRDITVVVAQQQSQRVPALPPTPPDAATRPTNPLGLSVGDLTPDQRKTVGRGGAQVLASSGLGQAAGILKGDLILRIGNVDVDTAKAFEQQAGRLATGRPVAVMIRRGDSTIFVPIRLPGR